jgi:hypothetical protein
LSERADHPVHLLVERGDGDLEVLDVVQDKPDVVQDKPNEQGVVVGEPPLRARRSSGILARSLPLASSARTSGSRSPATSALSMARPETPSTWRRPSRA